MFKLWSQTNIKAKELLTPNLGMRSLSDCNREERKIILKNFINKGWFIDSIYESCVHDAIRAFGDANKAANFCPETLNHGGPHFSGGSFLDGCCKRSSEKDFGSIFLDMPTEISYELISYYVNNLENSEYNKQRDRFRKCFNDISNQFALDIIMVEDQFIPKQEEKIVAEIYKPVLSFLQDSRWKEVDVLLSDAFFEYRSNTPQGYSNCITNTVSAVQAFLQIIVAGKTGKGDISSLIPEASKKGLIPQDSFTEKIFGNIESILARERQETSIAHPKKQYANEKNARLILNLVMVFIQHCIQK